MKMKEAPQNGSKTEVANEMKEEEIRPRRHIRKVDEPIEGSNANNKGVGIVSNKTKENTKKYIGQEDQVLNKQAEQVYLEKLNSGKETRCAWPRS